MARIAGVNIPPQKRVEIGLTYIYGVGRSTSTKVLGQLGINPDTKVRDLTEEEVVRLREAIIQLKSLFRRLFGFRNVHFRRSDLVVAHVLVGIS